MLFESATCLLQRSRLDRCTQSSDQRSLVRTVRTDPLASVLIEGMRDIGYRLETALADVIDNSITARASTIRIFAETDNGTASIGVLDDGDGMSENELIAAMRVGSRSPRETRDPSDLGRFGLGLKTASFSQCRRLTVVSRKGGATAAARWDLDRVVRSNEWQLEVAVDVRAIPWSAGLGKHGTLVLWEDLDRVIPQDGSDRDGAYFAQRLDGARRHLELVFHRFLTGEPPRLRKTAILLNDRPLESFDPFHSGHPATIRGPRETIKVGEETIVVQAFTLPHHQKVTAAEWERYAGLGGYARESGFYVYRGGRLIIHGTWFGLARQTELTKLARVRVDIPNGLDASWKIDVLKASAHPPYQVRERLRRIIEEMAGASVRVYTSRGRRLASDDRLPVWSRMQDKNQIKYKINLEHPVFDDLAKRLPNDLAGSFRNALELIGATVPMDALYADMGSEPDKVARNELDDETLGHAIRTAYRTLQESALDHAGIVDMLHFAEPFRSNWPRVERLLATIRTNGETDE